MTSMCTCIKKKFTQIRNIIPHLNIAKISIKIK